MKGPVKRFKIYEIDLAAHVRQTRLDGTAGKREGEMGNMVAEDFKEKKRYMYRFESLKRFSKICNGYWYIVQCIEIAVG